MKDIPFIDPYNWKEISFPSRLEDWKMFKANNKKIDLNVLCVLYNTEEIIHACILKHNSTRENQVIFLVITNVKKRHYIW